MPKKNKEERVNMSASEIAESMGNTFQNMKLIPDNRIESFKVDLKNYLNNPDIEDSEKYRILNIMFNLASGKFSRDELLELNSTFNKL